MGGTHLGASLLLAVCCLLPLGNAQAADDEVRLRDGGILRGHVVAVDENLVVLRAGSGLKSLQRSDVQMIVFAGQQAAGGLPAGISVGPGLSVARWITFHRITRFGANNDVRQITNCKLSANGRQVAFSSIQGTYTLDADGGNLVRLDERRNDGMVDISADGRKIAWCNDQGAIYVASRDGSSRVQMPGGFQINSLRMTADGNQLYVLCPQQGILQLPADGGGIRKVVTTEQVARVGGVDANGNHWRGNPSGLDVSDDGSRIVCHFLWNAFGVQSDGSGLRQLSRLERDANLSFVRISGNGQKVAWLGPRGNDSLLTITDWGGGNPAEYRGTRVQWGSWMQLSPDASQVGLSWGWQLLATSGRESLDVLDMGLAGDEPKPLHRASMATMAAGGARACVVLDGPTSTAQAASSQLAIVDLNPPSIGPAPRLEEITVQPRFVLNNNGSAATVSARSGGPDLPYVGFTTMRDGWRADYIGWPNRGLNDEGRDGDVKAGDGVFSDGGMRVGGDPAPAPGPLRLRVFAFTKGGDGLMVEVDGLDLRAP